MVHAGLDDRRLVGVVQAQQGQGGADVVIEVLRRLQDAVLLGENGGDHVLGGGLPHAAGDLHHGDGELLPVMAGQVLQGQAGVRHLDVELVGPQVLRELRAEDARRPLVQGSADEAVAVELLPHDGDEKAPGGDVPAVRGDGADILRPLPGVPPDAADSLLDLTDAHGLHAQVLLTARDRRTISSQSSS